MTFRVGASEYRLKNLIKVLSWHAQTHSYPIVLVEQDKSSQLLDINFPGRVSHIFVRNAGPFNKAWGLNIGAASCRSEKLIFTDADNLMHKSLKEAVDLCCPVYHFVKPYRQFIDLSQEQTDYILDESSTESVDFSRPDWFAQRENRGETFSLCSGTFIISRDLFDKLGGWDERFLGWGGEDDALSYKLQRMQPPSLGLSDNCVFHLWHPKAPVDEFHYLKNLEVLARYKTYTNNQLLWMSELQRQGKASVDKYKN